MDQAKPVQRKHSDAYHHGDLRSALIDAAVRQVEQGGGEAVSLTALARTLGVSQAAPYRHFTDRDELMAAVATQGYLRLGVALQGAVETAGEMTRLEAIARAYVGFGAELPGLYRLMYASRVIEQSAVGSELQRTVEALFLWALPTPSPDQDQALREHIGLKLWVSLHGVVMLTDQGFLPLKIRPLHPDVLVAEFVAEAQAALDAAAAGDTLSRP